MPDRLGRTDAIERFATHPLTFLADAMVRDKSGRTPYTYAVLGFVLFVFSIEVWFMLLAGTASTYPVVVYFFANYPRLAWLLAPFIHEGVRHFAVNVVGIYILAPVEGELSRIQYLSLLIFSGFLPVYADGLKLVEFGSEPNVTSAGASAFAFGLAGFGLVSVARSDWRLTPRWWAIATIGIAGIGLVLIDISLTALNGDPVTLHLGHFGGLLVGLGFGLLDDGLCR